MGGFQNFAISFTIISILAGCLASYYIAFESGGPIAVERIEERPEFLLPADTELA